MDSNQQVAYFIGYLLAFIIGVLIMRILFGIPKFMRYQRAKLKLLAMMADKQKVDSNLIKTILYEADHSFTSDKDFGRNKLRSIKD